MRCDAWDGAAFAGIANNNKDTILLTGNEAVTQFLEAIEFTLELKFVGSAVDCHHVKELIFVEIVLVFVLLHGLIFGFNAFF